MAEFSKYDAGWLHDFRSTNRGDLRAATWDDLNYPSRLGALAAAGVQMIQRDNAGSVVATQALAESLGLGISWREPQDLLRQLHDEDGLKEVRSRVWQQRELFTFDHHADALIAFFRKVISGGSTPRC